MATYSYIRTLVNGRWDINNELHVDGGSNKINIAHEIDAALPGKIFNMRAKGNNADFIFSSALSAGDQTILTNIVTNHKNNT